MAIGRKPGLRKLGSKPQKGDYYGKKAASPQAAKIAGCDEREDQKPSILCKRLEAWRGFQRGASEREQVRV
jgi:hypothetical protein